MKIKTKIIASILVFLSICLILSNLNMQSIFASEISTGVLAKGMVVLEGNTNTVLLERNMHERLPMASTTKIITAILAIENCNNLDEKIKISSKAVGIEGTSIYIKEGEELTMRELLYGLILASGNDCAVAIAEALGGEELFVNKMNDFASSLNLVNTHFDNPHGLDSDNHYTSAYDLAVMTSYALKNPTFKEIVSTERMVIEPTGIYQARYLKHKNRLLFSDDKCIGVKTGFTDNAGRCLVHAHEENGMQLISVVLNCQPMFEECDRLTKMALDKYVMMEFVKPYNYVSNIEIEDGTKLEIGVITINGFELPVLKDKVDDYEVKYELPEKLTAPIKLNQVVGSVKVLNGDNLIYEGDLITIEDTENNNIKYLFDNIIDRWF